ncbi:hypothetical protein llg_24120 [Luteolibacter sp. LG18]|nr:hypothetical protein llg_24120 [Luteolibacter sp. LG18]
MNATTRKPVALVTGASSGMGKIIASRLIEKGYHVIAAARRTEQMAGLERLGATIVHMDLSKEESIETAVTEILASFGSVDVLVNNAGFGLQPSSFFRAFNEWTGQTPEQVRNPTAG